MIKFLISIVGFLILIICHLSFVINPIYAASPSPIPLGSDKPQYATDSVRLLKQPVQVLGDQASDSGILTNNVDQKLEDLKREIASKAAQLKSEVNKKIGNKAVLGTVTVSSTDRITINSKNGSRTIKLNEYTLYQNDSKQKSKKAFTLDQIQTSDSLVCLGDVDENGVMTAKKVVKVDPPQKRNYSYLAGKIDKTDNLTFVLQLMNSKQSVNINFNAKTIVQNGKTEGSSADLKSGRDAVVVLVPDKEASAAAFIYLPPESSLVKPK